MGRKKFLAILALPLIAMSCTDSKPSSIKSDQQVATNQLTTFQQTQPVPVFDHSQLRQNLIEVETAQARGVSTTTFFFQQGADSPVRVCPSIGFPVPASYQLTNPDQAIGDIGDNGSGAVISQLESTGVYTGDTTATYVFCLDPSGKARAVSWEGFVMAETGNAHWDTATRMVVPDGNTSYEFSAK